MTVYVVSNMDDFIIGIFRTLEGAKECALEEIKDICERSGYSESEKSNCISELNEYLYVDEMVYIRPETLYD